MNSESQITAVAQQLLDALRRELHEYGAMLALLNQQQDAVVNRAADDVLRSVSAISELTSSMEQARQSREACRCELTRLLVRPQDAKISELAAVLPSKFRSGVTALVSENNQLLVRVRQRARQNHLLLRRSLELMERVLGAVLPGSQPGVYNTKGKMPRAQAPLPPLYDAIG